MLYNKFYSSNPNTNAFNKFRQKKKCLVNKVPDCSQYYYYYYWYSALGPVWAETRVQSGDWYGSGTLHPGQVLRSSLPLLSPGSQYIKKS